MFSSFLRTLQKYSIMTILFYDSAAVLVAWWIAFFLRENFSHMTVEVLQHSLRVQGVVLCTHLFFYNYYQTYRPLWRFFSLSELLQVSKAVASAWISSIAILFFLQDLKIVPVSTWFIYPLWLVLILGFGRLVIRHISDAQKKPQQTKRLLLIGAEKEALIFLRTLELQTQSEYQVIACLSDDITLHGKQIRHVPIVGNIQDLSSIAKKYRIEQVMITLNTVERITVRSITNTCTQLGISVRILPSLMEKRVENKNVLSRAVSLEDLLGRESVELDLPSIGKLLSNQTVLVSGGGGSIGSELCRQIVNMHPKKLIILDHSEFNLYQMAQELSLPNVVTVLASIVDRVSIFSIIKKHQPDIIIHAAAYKHVPILEHQPFQAVKNNLFGTQCLADAAVFHRVKKFIMISSDKAVNPTNVMGMTKRAAEIFCQAYDAISQTQLVTVRFGNVLGSTGSVIPLFQQQIAAGGPLTVTDPKMTRYFMTIREASQLVLQAGAMGKGGEIFVLDMGSSINIFELAKDLIILSGHKVEEIKIIFTGLRPGEKLFEELFYSEETMTKTTQKKIFKANLKHRHWSEIKTCLQKLENGYAKQDEMQLMGALHQLLALDSQSTTSVAPSLEEASWVV